MRIAEVAAGEPRCSPCVASTCAAAARHHTSSHTRHQTSSRESTCDPKPQPPVIASSAAPRAESGRPPPACGARVTHGWPESACAGSESRTSTRSGGAEEQRSGGAEERRSGGAEERSGGAEERRSGGGGVGTPSRVEGGVTVTPSRRRTSVRLRVCSELRSHHCRTRQRRRGVLHERSRRSRKEWASLNRRACQETTHRT